MSEKEKEKDQEQKNSGLDDDDYRESEDEDFNPDADDQLSEDEEESKEDKAQIKGYEKLQGSNLVKTRAQRDEEAKQEKQYKKAEKSTADIDALWASMNKGNKLSGKDDGDGGKVSKPEDTVQQEPEEYITIEREYKFAGQVTTEKKRVPKSSAEARAYLAQQKNPSSVQIETQEAEKIKPRKGPARKKRSALEAELKGGKPAKMNTLEKSRLDWAGFVDKEGISDELTHHNKGGYLHKQDFLSKVEHRLDEDWKKGQKK